MADAISRPHLEPDHHRSQGQVPEFGPRIRMVAPQPPPDDARPLLRICQCLSLQPGTLRPLHSCRDHRVAVPGKRDFHGDVVDRGKAEPRHEDLHPPPYPRALIHTFHFHQLNPRVLRPYPITLHLRRKYYTLYFIFPNRSRDLLLHRLRPLPRACGIVCVLPGPEPDLGGRYPARVLPCTDLLPDHNRSTSVPSLLRPEPCHYPD